LNWLVIPNFAADFLNLSFPGLFWISFCDFWKTINGIDLKFSLSIHVPISYARN
jgi:hypothetical protein